MAKRKTATDKEREREAANARVWPQFRAQVDAANTREDVIALLATGPTTDQPGGRYYANLDHFVLRGFGVPSSATPEERCLYVSLIRRMDAAGQLQAGAAQRIEKVLTNAC